MSMYEDRAFIVNYMVDKEVNRIKDSTQEIEKAIDGCNLLLNYVEGVKESLGSKEENELDVSEIQRHLIKIAALSIHLSTDVCYVA